MKYKIVDICKDLNLNLLNEKDTRSRRDYNCYIIDYSANFDYVGVNPQLLVETVFIVTSFPVEIKKASSMIYDYLKSIGNEKAISNYKLEPFDIKVQTLERTLVDKVFAICDYMLDGKLEKHSRHIYDISRLLKFVSLNDELKTLINDVRIERKNGTKCYSAKDGVVVSDLLQMIIDSNCFRKDYENTTEKLLSKVVTYDEAIKSLKTIIESGIFE